MRLLYFSQKRYFHGGGWCFGLSPGGVGLGRAGSLGWGDKMSPKHKVTTKQVRLSAYHPASDTMELPLLLKLPPGVSGSPSLQAALAPVSQTGQNWGIGLWSSCDVQRSGTRSWDGWGEGGKKEMDITCMGRVFSKGSRWQLRDTGGQG